MNKRAGFCRFLAGVRGNDNGEGMSRRGCDLAQALERIDQLQVKIEVSPRVLSYHRPAKRVQLVDRFFVLSKVW